MRPGPILVVGASGLLGRALVKASLDSGQEAVGLTRSECDITDPASVAKALDHYRPRILVNTAAFTNVDAAEGDRGGAHAVNADGPEIIGAASADRSIPVIHVSTDCVFDGRRERAYTEDDPIAPIGWYGHTKASGEARLRDVQPQHVVLRTAWLFGDGGGGFVRMAISAALSGQPVRTVVDQIGSPTAAGDLAGAILAVDAMIEQGFADWGTYHYAGEEPASRVDMVETIFAAVRGLGRDVAGIVPMHLADFAALAPRPANSILDSSRFVRIFGFPASDWRGHLVAQVRREAAAKAEQQVV